MQDYLEKLGYKININVENILLPISMLECNGYTQLMNNDREKNILENEKYRKRFAENMETNTKVRFFQKVPHGVKDLGLYKVTGFKGNSVVLEK